MLQIKLAAALMMPLAFFCAVATAQQQQQPDSHAKPTAAIPLKPQTPTPPPVKVKPRQGVFVADATPTRKRAPVQGATSDVLPPACSKPAYIVPPGDVYGTYVPYAASDQPAACTTPNAQPQGKIAGPHVPDIAPTQTPSAGQSTASDILPTACPTPVYAVPPGDVYGAYVPYVAPAQPIGCGTPAAPAASTNSSPVNSSVVQKPQAASLLDSNSPPALRLAPPTSGDLALAPEAAPSPAPAPAEGAYVRPVPTQRAATIPPELRPFRSWAIGFRASTLGTGIELATPLAGRINLRSSFNLFAFNDPYSMDGINYDARMHLQSSQTTLDWFVGRFHISPGFMYFKNAMSAPVFVGPGKTFVLGTQTFLNSVDDPVTGSSYVIFPRTIAPLLLLGYGNLLPRSGEHLSLPVEVGVAYTGAAQINVDLNGTACVNNGCVNFSQNADAQKSLKQEINILNEDLKHYPVFPIVSVGLAYRF
jgi:hypothetical protein